MLPVVVRGRGTAGRLVVAVALVVFARQVFAQPTRPDSAIAWELYLHAGQPATEFRAIAANDATVFVAATDRSTLEPRESSQTTLRVWSLDLDGRRKAETELTDLTTVESNTRTIRDVTALAGGEALVLADFVAGRPSLVRIDAAGRQAATRRVMPDNRTVTLLRMVPMPGGRHLLIGHESLDAIAVLVDASGAALWDRVYDRGRMDFFVDGVASVDGGAILVGNSGTYEAMLTGESHVWVGKYDASGIAGRERTFPGRYGRIAGLPDGGVAVVYDRSATLEREVRVKRLDADMQELWDVAIDVTKKGVGDFRIAARADGALVVAGMSSGVAGVVSLDTSGRPLTSWMAEPGVRAVDLGPGGLVLDRVGNVVIAGSHVQAESKTNVKYQVRVRRLGGRPAQRGL